MPPERAANLQSAIYTGTVFHRRFAERDHTLCYRSFYCLIDLDELDDLAGVSALFGYNAKRWFAFQSSDHGTDAEELSTDAHRLPLGQQFTLLLEDNGIFDERWRFQLLTMPRTLGYVFNPISLVYCYRSSGELSAMIYEVNNTFGERTHYVLPATDDGPEIRHRCAKRMFVSPFFPVDGDYEFLLTRPQSQLRLTIDYRRNDALALRAAFSGKRLAFDGATLRRLALTHSTTTYKTIAAIHYEAFKLWAKGLPLIKHTPLAMKDNTAITRTPYETR